MSKQPDRKVTTTPLPLSKLHTDGGTQSRGQLDTAVVADYAAAYERKAPLPPLVAFHDGTSYWLVDGFHRLEALRTNHTRTAQVEVHLGTQIEAIWYAAGANKQHGLRRTNEDKQRAVVMALDCAGKMSPQPSSRQIAEHVGVDHKTVEKYRSRGEAWGNSPRLEERLTNDGRRVGKVNRLSEAPPLDEAPEEEPPSEPVFDELGQEIADPTIAAAFTVLLPYQLEIASAAKGLARAWASFHAAQSDAKQVRITEARSYDFTRKLIERDLNQVGANIEAETPYALCPYCRGAPFVAEIAKRCRACLGGGWIDKAGYEGAPPEKKQSPKGAGHG